MKIAKRERRLAQSIQKGLERLYQIEHALDVAAFLAPIAPDEREQLSVWHSESGDVHLELRIPALGSAEFELSRDTDLDPLCQIIEGVSHFVYISHRIRTARETTQLELELQAEVDKYVILAASFGDGAAQTSASIRARLFERVSFQHAPTSEQGERYRLANSAADRFTRHLERECLATQNFCKMRSELQRFFRMGQNDKLRVALAG